MTITCTKLRGGRSDQTRRDRYMPNQNGNQPVRASSAEDRTTVLGSQTRSMANAKILPHTLQLSDKLSLSDIFRPSNGVRLSDHPTIRPSDKCQITSDTHTTTHHQYSSPPFLEARLLTSLSTYLGKVSTVPFYPNLRIRYLPLNSSTPCSPPFLPSLSRIPTQAIKSPLPRRCASGKPQYM